MDKIIILAVLGTVMLAAEMLIPGGIVGLVGLGFLVASVVLAFQLGVGTGIAVAFGVFVVVVIALALWMRYFHKTPIGKYFTLRSKVRQPPALEENRELIGKSGTAQTDLRPSGKALIDGSKIDVVSESRHIARDTEIKVVQVEGNRIVVRAAG